MVGFCHVGNLPESHYNDNDDDYDDDYNDNDDNDDICMCLRWESVLAGSWPIDLAANG